MDFVWNVRAIATFVRGTMIKKPVILTKCYGSNGGTDFAWNVSTLSQECYGPNIPDKVHPPQCP